MDRSPRQPAPSVRTAVWDRWLGQLVTLRVLRIGSPGAFLAHGDDEDEPVVLLPGSEMDKDTAVGDAVEVFLYLDSEDRPVATIKTPKLVLGEVAFLEVTDVTSFGAFVAWGLMKDLLVPKAEQTRSIHVGETHPIGLYVDRTGRLAGTMRVSELLKDLGEFSEDEWVMGEAWRKEPGIGVFVIVEGRFVGLVPEDEPTSLARGQSARFRVSRVLDDGRIELSLRAPAKEQRDRDAERIREVLSARGAPRLGDKSTPQEIETHLGLSKKAFKRAAGRLLREGVISTDAAGFFVLRSSVDR